MLSESTPLPRTRLDPGTQPGGAVARARELVLAHGSSATAYQILNPGIAYWFSRAGDAVAGFVRHGGIRVVAGAPICAPERLAEAAAELEQSAAATGEGVCYFHAGERLEAIARRRGRGIAVLGGEPEVELGDRPNALADRAPRRVEIEAVAHRGVHVEEWPASRVTGSAALRRCLREWLATRRLPPLHFLTEADTLGRLFDRRVFVASRRGDAVAFLIASPIPARGDWHLEQIVRGRQAPRAAATLLIDAAFRAFAREGVHIVSLGFVPLSSHVEADARNPRWLRTGARWARRHGRRLYDFAGLEAFKARLSPTTWHPVLVVAEGPEFTRQTLHAVAGAFTGAPPLEVLRDATRRMAAREARALTRAALRRAAAGVRRLGPGR